LRVLDHHRICANVGQAVHVRGLARALARDSLSAPQRERARDLARGIAAWLARFVLGESR
jgi:hypothetical protein